MSKTVTLNKETIAAALVEEFANALAATLGGTATAAGSDAAGSKDPASRNLTGWLVTLPVSGGAAGTVTITCDSEGASAAAKAALMMTENEAPDAATVADLVKEIAGQAAGSLVLRSPFESLTFGPATIAEAKAGAWTPSTTLQIADIRCLVGAVAAVQMAVPMTPGVVSVAKDNSRSLETLDAVMDVDLPLTVRFGRTVMNLKALSALGPGSMVDMGRSPDEPVELLVGERLIARGEVVIVGGNYGVRVTEITRHRQGVEA
ncbi:MAG TPA: FliM/FliN family flagellar motor switch protein [Vicinamibacterales bacterium]|nr:FliM/FliN family flagellar motor switch protein [Vicinamibacterales bacterium]